MMDFVSLAQQCAPTVAPQTLAAIVKSESSFRPLTIGVNGGRRLVRQPATVQEAVATARWLIAKGYNIDLGISQVNSANLRRAGLTVETAFDPCKNLAAGAGILQANYIDARRTYPTDQTALHAALSMYNTGNFTAGIANGYVQKVVANANVTAKPVQIVPPINGAIPVAATKPKKHSDIDTMEPVMQKSMKRTAAGRPTVEGMEMERPSAQRWLVF